MRLASPFPPHLPPRTSELGRLRPGYAAAPIILGFSVTLGSTRSLPAHLWGTRAGSKPRDLTRSATRCGGGGGRVEPECGRGLGLQEDPGQPRSTQTLKFFHLATYWRYLGSTEPTYLHAYEKKTKLTLTTGRRKLRLPRTPVKHHQQRCQFAEGFF